MMFYKAPPRNDRQRTRRIGGGGYNSIEHQKAVDDQIAKYDAQLDLIKEYCEMVDRQDKYDKVWHRSIDEMNNDNDRIMIETMKKAMAEMNTPAIRSNHNTELSKYKEWAIRFGMIFEIIATFMEKDKVELNRFALIEND